MECMQTSSIEYLRDSHVIKWVNRVQIIIYLSKDIVWTVLLWLEFAVYAYWKALFASKNYYRITYFNDLGTLVFICSSLILQIGLFKPFLHFKLKISNFLNHTLGRVISSMSLRKVVQGNPML